MICIDKRAEFQDFYRKVIAVDGGQPTKYAELGINRNIALKIVDETADKMIFKAK